MHHSKEIKLKVVVLRGDGERFGMKIFVESNKMFSNKRKFLITYSGRQGVMKHVLVVVLLKFRIKLIN